MASKYQNGQIPQGEFRNHISKEALDEATERNMEQINPEVHFRR